MKAGHDQSQNAKLLDLHVIPPPFALDAEVKTLRSHG